MNYKVPVYYEMKTIIEVETTKKSTSEELYEKALEKFREMPLNPENDTYIPLSEKTDKANPPEKIN